MKIIRNINVPTGNILITEGARGRLELVSIGDYGKDVNVKFDAIGLDRELSPVKHQKMLPLEEKWVITISTQYGCSMGCMFCDVPKVGPGKNATYHDLNNQILTGIFTHPEVKRTNRLNVHFARMGEPTFNKNVLICALWLKNILEPYIGPVHPVVSTMLPRKNKNLKSFLMSWMNIKNRTYSGNAGLQLSINSTSEQERILMFNGNCLSLAEISKLMSDIEKPKGRKITLNFAVAGYEINPDILLKYFDPEYYLIKLTPMHKTKRATQSGIETDGDYTSFHPYEEYEKNLKKAGYDVIVFIASSEEDLGRITCGNAILSGTEPITITKG